MTAKAPHSLDPELAGIDSTPADAAPVELVVDFDQLAKLTGREFRSAWFVVEAEKLALFDAATYTDRNPYPFADEDYPDGLVEGFHLLGLLDHLSNPLLRLTDGPLAGWNYGLDRVRFVSPVRAGQPIRLTGVVAQTKARTDGVLVLLACTLEIAGHARPGLVADWWVLFQAPRSSRGPGETDAGQPASETADRRAAT